MCGRAQVRANPTRRSGHRSVIFNERREQACAGLRPSPRVDLGDEHISPGLNSPACCCFVNAVRLAGDEADFCVWKMLANTGAGVGQPHPGLGERGQIKHYFDRHSVGRLFQFSWQVVGIGKCVQYALERVR